MVPLDRYTHFKYFEIWSPRYRDSSVLLAKHKVGEHNKIVFTKAPSLGTEPYYFNGKNKRGLKTESNGRIDCLVVPLSRLEPLLIAERSIHDLR